MGDIFEGILNIIKSFFIVIANSVTNFFKTALPKDKSDHDSHH